MEITCKPLPLEYVGSLHKSTFAFCESQLQDSHSGSSADDLKSSGVTPCGFDSHRR